MIRIDIGVFQFPVVKTALFHNVQVTITHCNDLGIAIAFPEEHPIGIDIDKLETIKSFITEDEHKLLLENGLLISFG